MESCFYQPTAYRHKALEINEMVRYGRSLKWLLLSLRHMTALLWTVKKQKLEGGEEKALGCRRLHSFRVETQGLQITVVG